MLSKSTGKKTIQKIKVSKKKVVITFNDKTKLDLSLEVMANFYLYEKKELSAKEIKEIKDFSNSSTLLKYAMSLLKKGHCSEWKMREKLYAKEGKKSDVDRIIKILKSHDLIDDHALALDLYEYGNERNLGKNKIIKEISSKGIFDDVIAKLKFPDSLEKKKALANLDKLERKYSKYSYEQKKQHIYAALLSLGFDSDIAHEALNHIKDIDLKDEKVKLDKDFEKVLVRLKKKYEGYELKNKVISTLKGKGYKTKDILRKWEDKYDENDF